MPIVVTRAARTNFPAGRLVAALCAAEILGMAGFSIFAGLLPRLTREWSLTGAEAGWISGIYYGGYTAAVPVFMTITDRLDARRIYLLGTALGAASSLAFAVFADGFWSALLLRAAAGIGLAGTYMPGLKALADRIDGTAQARAVGFYTASFGIGGSASYALAGLGEGVLGWRAAFAIAAIGSAIAYGIADRALAPMHGLHTQQGGKPPAGVTAAALRNRIVIACIIGYSALNFQLFGFRSWIVAFLSFSAASRGENVFSLDPTLLAAAMTIVSVPAAIVGNEIAVRYGYRGTVVGAMSIAAAYSCLFGFSAKLQFLIVIALSMVYAVLVCGMGSALTSALIANSDQRCRGALVAIYSSIGFAGASIGPIIFGTVLDALDANNVLAWGIAFAVLGLGGFIGPLAFIVFPRRL